MKAALLLIFSSLIYTASCSTQGTLFHLVFLENIPEFPADAPLEVHVSNTGTTSAVVTVSSPGTSCGSQTATVAVGSSSRLEVCWWMRLKAQDYWPTSKTVLVESTAPVSVYGVNKERYTTDGFYAIPVNELSTAYYVAAYGNANIATQFGISAVTSPTTIQITLPSPSVPLQVNYKGTVYTNGDRFIIQLNQYETYLAQCRGDLSGTRIISSNPIAVFSGNVRNKASSGSRDHIVAQLAGTGDWGTKFAVNPVPRTENKGDMVRVMARQAGTSFTIRFATSNSNSQTLASPGDFYEFMATEPLVITASDSTKPLQVIQMVRSQISPFSTDYADPVMFLLVSSNQWLNSYVSPQLTSQVENGIPYRVNYAMIAIQSGQESGVRLDGNSLNQQWSRIDNLAFTWVQISAGTHSFTHTSNTRMGVTIYGASDRESYGFALGADLSVTGISAIITNPSDPTGTQITIRCVESLMVRGDGSDNDCDNVVDEETCNGIDDDNDGLIDEDCRQTSVEAFGNTYVIMFMENNVDDNPNAVSQLEIYMSAVDNSVTSQVTLENKYGLYPLTIPPNTVEIFDQLNVSLRHVGSGISDKAIYISGDQDIVVYGINKQTFSTDGFLAFSVDVVGTEYYTSHYFPGDDLNEFAVTPITRGATTTVTVTIPLGATANFGAQTISPGTSYTFDLAFGETAQIQGASNNDNLNGARIQSNLPVSAFSGNVRAKVDPQAQRSRDHLVQQLSPVNTWGSDFVTVPAPRGMPRGDIFTITASQPSTTVSIAITDSNGNRRTLSETLSIAGDHKNVDIATDEYSFIQADKPIQVMQYVKTSDDRNVDNADPAMMLVPPISQWSNDYQFVTPRSGQLNTPNDPSSGYIAFDNYVMIVIDRNQRNGLRLDGTVISPTPTWVDISDTSYSATVIQVGSGRHSLSHIDSSILYQAMMYGRADRESYGLPLGMKFIGAGQCQITPQTAGDSIDNDCDNVVDEELCNGVDDDFDGLVDEDCGSGLTSGTAFYLTFMENTVEYPRYFDLEVYVAVVGTQPATVSVAAPMRTFPVYQMSNEIQPGDVQQYGFTWNMRNFGQGITNNTIYVRGNSEVVVYGVNKEFFSNDAFLVYPESSLGTDYYTCSWAPSTLNTEFAVTATADNTQVTITLPSNRNNIAVQANSRTYSSGESFTISLNRFQTYQAQSSGDLTGTRVQSNRRVALFSGNVRTLVELSASRDHLVEQMLPTASYGTEFYVVPFPDRTVGDVLKIIARTSNTDVRVNGQLINRISSAGGFIQYQLASTSPVVITSSQAVMVVQYIKSQDGRNNPEQADPAMYVVPSRTNFITSATFITPVYSGGGVAGSDYTNYMTVVISNGEQGNLRLNGAPLVSLSWTSVGTNFVTATFNVPSGRSHSLTTSSGAEFYGRLYGRADRESYVFSVGFKF